MRNFYDTSKAALEAKCSPTLTKVSRDSKATLHNVPAESANLYYVKYEMLNSGRVNLLTAKETPHVPMLPSSPNDRLIKQFSNYLKEQKIEHNFCVLSGIKTVSIQNIDWNELTTLLITSKPYNGLSYIHVVALNNKMFPGLQVNVSFIAQTPEQIYEKIIRFGLPLMLCPKSQACVTRCPDCPELKGGQS